MQKHQRGRLRFGKKSTIAFISAIFFEIKGGPAMGGAQGRIRPVDYRQRHEIGNFAPSMPAMKACEIICAHEPDKIDAATALREITQSVIGKARANLSLNAADENSGMMSQFFAGLQACGKRWKIAILLQWIAGRHQPPDAIQIKTPQSNQTG